MGRFAVIDTETNWQDQVMSIGTVIADDQTFQIVQMKYYIFPEESQIGGMYENTLYAQTPVQPIVCKRCEAMEDLKCWLQAHGADRLFAYNASFDRNHLPELRTFAWFDIMRLAAYRQYNPKIPADAPCCSTGRMKRGYGVEPMLRLLSGSGCYRESHNACLDALDELELMRLLGHNLHEYIPL